MDITLLPPTHILTHHSHLSLLPSALPKTRYAPSSSFTSTSSTSSSSSSSSLHYLARYRKVYQPLPPSDGSSPLLSLPDEILLSIFSWLDFEDLLNLRLVSPRLGEVALSGSLHRTLTLTTLPSTRTRPDGNGEGELPSLLRRILPSVRELHLHLFPYPLLNPSIRTQNPSTTILQLLRHIPTNQLRSLSLPFSAPYLPSTDLEDVLRTIGNGIRKLDLRGSALSGNGSWIEIISRMKDLREIDIGFTNITSFPLASQLGKLEQISLASCPSLSEKTLRTFLRGLPTSVRRLDLSRLDQIPFEALWEMKVVSIHGDDDEEEGGGSVTGLEEVRVVGIDHLTRRDIRGLKKHWEDQRRAVLSDKISDRTTKQRECAIARIEVEKRPSTPPSQSQSRYAYGLLSPPLTPGSETISTSSHSGGVGRSPYTPATSISSSLSTSPPISHRHPVLSSLTGIPTPLSSGRSAEAEVEEDVEDTVRVNIVHSAILESEDEDGYRRFIGEVVGGTLGIGLEVEQEGGYVEVDD
ncbi:hypothetical protein CI109_106388 [Kwoniella shandongensis]|uniref:Uncharacterized protein n=1 Tax=Kwoniella shandongensis TaxID=1734106 RepID=A0A5M6BU69_9TREE|nr:uncharacterized protein CI109_005904 [Kwoniella shandongensis]KAA5525741.1 hypothetical protein CI109_005904 [Kwoniella shandongensis]